VVYPRRLGNLNACPERFRLTVAITERGNLKAWQVADLKGTVLEEWTADLDAEVHQYTWEVGWDAYLVVRDVLRFIGEADWQPGTVM